MRKSTKQKQILQKLILCAVLAAVMVFLSACGCSASENDYLTRAEWIALLGRNFGLTTYQQEAPYYADVPADHAVFSYVQAGREWEILRAEGAFDPNAPATKGFVAETALLTALSDYDTSLGEKDTKTLLRLAVENGIVSSGKTGDKMTAEDCVRAIVGAKDCRLTYEVPEYADITVKDTVADYSASEDVQMKDGKVVMPKDMSADIAVGTVFIVPGEPYGTAVKAASVKTVNGQTVIETVTPEIEEVFDNVSFSFTAGPKLEDILPLHSGITITPAGSTASALSSGFCGNSPFVTLSTGTVMRARGKTDPLSFNVDFNIAKGTLKTDPAYTDYYKNAADKFAALFGNSLSDEALEALKNSHTAIGEDGSIDQIPRYTGGYEITGSLSVKNLYAEASCKENLKSFTCQLHFEVDSSLTVKGKLEGAIPIYETKIAGPNGICVKVIFSIYADMNGEAVIGAELVHTSNLSYRGKNFKTVQSTEFTPSGALCAGFSSGVKAEAIPTVWGLPMIDVSAKVGTAVDVNALYRDGGNIPVICVDGNAYSPVVSLAVGEDVKTLANKIGIKASFKLIDKEGALIESDSETLWHYEITSGGAKLVEKCTYGGVDPQDPTEPTTEPPTTPPTNPPTEPPKPTTPPTEPPKEPLTPSEGLLFAVYKDHCVVTDASNCGDKDIVIPSSYKGLPVTGIGDKAFIRKTTYDQIRSVTIPDSVTSIGSWAFSKSTIESITIPNSVTSIGDSAFNSCTSLKSIAISDSVSNISASMFYGCTSLKNIVIPTGVTSIGDSAFKNCTSLTGITLPNGVTSIGSWAFEGCTSLTSITLPKSVSSIGTAAFFGCKSLKSIAIPDGVTSFGKSTFYGCKGLTSITLPNSLTSIGELVFQDCISLTNITLPNSLTSIGNNAFRGCTSLTNITLPNSLTSIGYNVFQGCTRLTSVTLPNSLTSIGNNMFQGCTDLRRITYKGTMEQWKKLSLDTYWHSYSSITEVICSDGKVSLK